MASPAVQRRRLLLAGFVTILVVAWAMNAIGGTEPRRASNARASGTPRVTVAPLPPSAVQLTAPGFTFSPDACVAFPPTTAGPAKATVFLDVGHGGVDPGTGGRTSAGRRVQEKTATLAVVKAATQQLNWRKYAHRVIVLVPSSPAHPNETQQTEEFIRSFHGAGGIVHVEVRQAEQPGGPA